MCGLPRTPGVRCLASPHLHASVVVIHSKTPPEQPHSLTAFPACLNVPRRENNASLRYPNILSVVSLMTIYPFQTILCNHCPGAHGPLLNLVSSKQILLFSPQPPAAPILLTASRSFEIAVFLTDPTPCQLSLLCTFHSTRSRHRPSSPGRARPLVSTPTSHGLQSAGRI